jgi:S-adenosylmethionine:tRNA ribosyltransferase-isomerase
MFKNLRYFFKIYNYNYELPKDLIATYGISPRDHAKLLVVDTKNNRLIHDYFYNLSAYLPKETLLILNKTKVVKSRVYLKKPTGGKVEVFFLANEINDPKYLKVLVDRKINISEKITSEDGTFSFEIIGQNENIFILRSEQINSLLDLEMLLDLHGKTPLPKYIKNEKTDNENFERYQTIFAKEGMSVAAPTASLHFTENVFSKLKEKNCELAHLVLNVGMGTFKNPTKEQIKTKVLHEETGYIEKDELAKILTSKLKNKKILTVGTTATRAIEHLAHNNFKDTIFTTSIFIQPGYEFKVPNFLLTNFHLPNTSLMMLVQAFLRHKGSKLLLNEIYEEAVAKKYRFYSFGDSMLII